AAPSGPRGRPRPARGCARLRGLSAAPRGGARGARRCASSEGQLMDVVSRKTITVDINGERFERDVDARRLLIHFIRDDLDLTGSHIGCDTGNCGACSVLVDGVLVKSCMMLAIQADGARIETVEGLAQDGEL